MGCQKSNPKEEVQLSPTATEYTPPTAYNIGKGYNISLYKDSLLNVPITPTYEGEYPRKYREYVGSEISDTFWIVRERGERGIRRKTYAKDSSIALNSLS